MFILNKKIYKSKVAVNGAWLYLLQIFNTVIPLITLPYITRILGPSEYGVFSSALNLVGYFQVVVEYGFTLSGSRKVAITNDKSEISTIYSRILLSKLFLCLITFLVLIVITRIINISAAQMTTMIVLYSMVLGMVFQQTWLFQGLEDMKYITIISVVARLISVLLIFMLINNSRQVYLYSALYAITYLLTGVIGTLIIRYKYNIRLKKIKLNDILDELKDGWYLFSTSAMAKIFGGIGITVLTFTTSENFVGIYSAIQKIPLIITMLYAPIGQVIYPIVSKYYAVSLETGIELVKKIMKASIPVVIIACLILTISSKFIVGILYGPDYSGHSLVLIPLTVWMGLSIINNLLGIQILVASGHLKEYSDSFKVGVIAIIIFNVGLGSIAGMYGVAFAAMFAELTLTISILYKIRRIFK